MNDMQKLHDNLHDLKRQGRKEGFAIGLLLVGGAVTYVKVRRATKKTEAQKRREAGFID